MERMWTKDQQLAIDTHGKNLLVSAAAGSGKTAVLVERIIKTIMDDEHPVDIEKMVVVTFTNAAAAQMRERIGVALEAAMEENPGNARLSRQLAMLSIAPITTIDSFCLNLLRNHYMKLDLDPCFRVADQGEMGLLKNDVMDDLLEEQYELGDDNFYELVECFGGKKDDGNLPELINKLYNCARSYPWPKEWLNECKEAVKVSTVEELDDAVAIKYLFDYVNKIFKSYKDIFTNLVELCQSEFGPSNYTQNIMDDLSNIEKMLACETFSQWTKVASNVEFTALSRKKAVNDVDDEIKEYVKNVRNDYKDFFKKLCGKFCSLELEYMLKNDSNTSRMIEELIKITEVYMDKVDEAKKEKSLIDFTDMELLARQLLVMKDELGNVTYTELADELADYYEEILIDEYQDSNMLQEQILTAISKGRLKNGINNMFMVGDVKQSIYKFRLARPDLFIEKYDTYPTKDGCDCIELSQNFRSRESVLFAVNSIFKNVMKRECGGIGYDKKVQLNPGAAWEEPNKEIVSRIGGKVKTYLVNSSNDDEDRSTRECEAHQIATIIEEIVDRENGMLIYDDKKKAYRNAEYGDIVILVRSIQGYAKEYAEVLLNSKIPACTQSTGGYYDTFEIEQILNVLAILDNPRQDIYLAAAITSYFGTLSLKELAKIKAFEKKASLYDSIKKYAKEHDDEMSHKINQFFAWVDEKRKCVMYLSIHNLIWQLVYDSGFYDYVRNMPGGSIRTTNLDMFLEKAKTYEKTSYHGLFNFLRYIEKVRKYELENASAGDDVSSDMVRIMSIHKSKGLEFPIVIVAGMSKKFNNQDARNSVVIDPELGIGVDVIDPVLRTKFKPSIKAAIETKIVLDNLAEEIRILYVALTRAKEKLIMVGTYSEKGKKLEKWKNQENFSYADIRACTSYYDMVMPIAFNHPELFEVEEVVAKHHDFSDGNENAYVDDISNEKEILESEKHFLESYPWQYATKMKGKMSVSEIKMMEHEAFLEPDLEEEVYEELYTDYDSIIPQFMNDNQPVNPAERGTAFHRVMECLDYDRIGSYDEIVSQMEDMQSRGLITPRQLKAVDSQKIWSFCESDLGKRIKAAFDCGNVYRERPFVMSIPASKVRLYNDMIFTGEVTKEQIDEETILIQGVIDLYFIEDGNIVLVDYKTDRVKEASELVDKYHIQLDYYADALNRVLGGEVSQKIIYSFCLDKVIEA